MGDDYHMVTEWRVPGTIEEVKDVLGDGEALPRWWPSVYLEVDEIDHGREDGVGRATRLHTKGWLPYTLRWTLRITEPLTDEGFALEASGDLEGTGRWTFTQVGGEVHITYDWRVHATKPLLRRLGWLFKPVFVANHRWAMSKGEESLILEIRRRRGGEGAVPVPPPPPPTFLWLRGGLGRGKRRPG